MPKRIALVILFAIGIAVLIDAGRSEPAGEMLDLTLKDHKAEPADVPLDQPRVVALKSEFDTVQAVACSLATADLESEPHKMPGWAVYEASDWIEVVLKDERRESWKITTVRKEKRFDFIHIEGNDLVMRQLPQVIALRFTPKVKVSEENVGELTRAWLISNVIGEWEGVKTDPPKRVDGALYVTSAGGGFSHRKGTGRDSFVAVGQSEHIWIALPRRLSTEDFVGYCFAIEEQSGWFDIPARR